MGRLIDADALREEVNGFGMTVTGLRAGKGVLQNYAKHYRDSINRIIDEAPTIDAVPVVHGRWEFGDDGKMHCCNCDKVPTNKILVVGHEILHIADVKQIMKYCPNCGAKMDLEVDGE